MRLAIAALVFGFILPAMSGQTQSVTVSAQAGTVKSLLPMLSEKTGLTLEAAPTTENEIICLKVTEVPPMTVLDRIAEAVDGEWHKTATGAYRLGRTPEQVRNEERAAAQKLYDQIKKGMDLLKKNTSGDKPFDKQAAEALADKAAAVLKTFNPNDNGSFYKKWEPLGKQMPGTRWLSMAVKSFTVEDYLSIPPNRKVVYSNTPTRSQRPLPASTSNLMQQWAKEANIWSDARARKGVKAPTVNGATYWFPGIEPDEQEGQEPGAPVRAVVMISRYGRDANYQLEMQLLDARGRQVAQGSSNLSGYDYEAMQQAEKDLKKSSEGDQKLEPDEFTKAMADLGRQQKQFKDLSPTLQQKILHPETTDPLSLMGSSTLIQFAEKKNINLVACLSDEDYYAYGPMSEDQPTLTEYYESLKMRKAGTEIKDGWLVLQPTDPVEARKNRADRKVLGEYLRTSAAGTEMSLEQRAYFAAALPKREFGYMAESLRQMVAGQETNQYFDENYLRLYGSLSASQRTQAAAGGVPVKSLSAFQTEIINDIVYGPWVDLQVRTNEKGEQPEGFDFETFYAGIHREPTESMPDGMAANAMLQIKNANDVVAFTGPMQMSEWTQPGQAFSASELAWQMFAQDNPSKFPWMNDEGQRRDLTKLKYGTRRNMTLTINMTPVLKVEQQLQEHKLGGDYLTFDKLPADFKKEVNEQLENYKKSYENVENGGGGEVGGGQIGGQP